MNDFVVDFDQLIDKYQSILCNQPNRIDRIRNGTFDQFYSDIIQDSVVDLSLINTNRYLRELEPLDDDDTMVRTFAVLIQMISTIFAKPADIVKKDLLKCLKDSPVNDIRTVAVLKSQNRLH